MSSFVCATCGETHEGMPTDSGWTLPDVVWAIPKDRRSSQAHYNADLCQFGNRFFIRCVLHLPFSEQPGSYAWGPWVELSQPHFARYLELYDQDGSAEPRVPGTLANEFPAYPSTLGLPVMVQFQGASSRPRVHVAADAAHPLAAEQADGIGNGRYHDFLVATGVLDEG